MSRRTDIKNPSIKAVRRRGFTPIKYRTAQSYVRYGWLIEKVGRRIRVRFPGDEHATWLPQSEERWIEELE